ncbi:MAG: DUF3006 domain-containing protein [Ruminococcus sp.]|nr:DUF3006 domain-containing protein [Ruminococcus sp.]
MLCVDRTEGELILCEDKDGRRVALRKEQCEGAPAEGDVLVKRGGLYRVSRRLTEKRRRELNALRDRLLNKK